MSDPLITPPDLGTYLNDPGIDQDRAKALIADAQTLCESVLSPLPDAASVVVKRVAGRAYATTLSPRQVQLAAAGGQFVGQMGGGVWLSQADIADLRRLAGGGGAFSIDVLPTGYVAPSSWWDSGSWYSGDWDQIV